MNAFADWLFSLLLGWTGRAANSVWNALTNSTQGISAFFSRYWLPILIVLVIGGTVADYVIWFVRRRPHYVWRSKFMQRDWERQLNGTEQTMEHGEMSSEYLKEIAGWVSDQEEPPLPELWQDAPQTQYSPYGEYSPQAEFVPEAAYSPQAGLSNEQYSNAPVYWQDSAPMSEDSASVPPETSLPYMDEYASEPLLPYTENAEQPLITAEMQYYYDSYSPPIAEQPVKETPPRRRRSERKHALGEKGGQRISRLFNRMPTHEDEDGMLDGLPPPVSQDAAFHSPVYPDSYRAGLDEHNDSHPD